MSNVLRVLWAMTRPLWRNHHIHNPLLTLSPADPLPFTTPLALASSIVDCQNLGQPHRLEDRAHFRFQFSFAFRPRSAVWISTVCWYGSRCNVHVHFEWERTYFLERLNHSLFSTCHTSQFCLWYSYNTCLRAWIRIYTKNHTKLALVEPCSSWKTHWSMVFPKVKFRLIIHLHAPKCYTQSVVEINWN